MSASAGRKPTVRPQLSRAFIEEIRRRRCADAAAEILHEFGRDGLTVSSIVSLAATSRASFYEVFSSVEECLSYTARLADEKIFEALDAQPGDGDWPTEVRSAIAGFYEAVSANPLLAETLLLHARTSRTDGGREIAWSVARRFEPLLRRGHREASVRGRRPPGEAIDAALSGAIISLATQRVTGSGVGELPQESEPTTTLVLGFYLGREYRGETHSSALAA
jgi:AcrR family transcriptional regulator